MDFDDITMNTNIAEGTLLGLQRRLQRFERWGFLVDESTGKSREMGSRIGGENAGRAAEGEGLRDVSRAGLREGVPPGPLAFRELHVHPHRQRQHHAAGDELQLG